MRTAELAALLGVCARTLRRYELRGLLHPQRGLGSRVKFWPRSEADLAARLIAGVSLDQLLMEHGGRSD